MATDTAADTDVGSILIFFVWLLAVNASQAAIGAAFLHRRPAPVQGAVARGALAWTMGSGVHTLLLFVLSAVGVPLTAPTMLGSAVLMSAIALTLQLKRFATGSQPQSSIRSRRRMSLLESGLEVAFVVLIVSQVIVLFGVDLAGRPAVTDEVAIWAGKGEGISSENSIAGIRWSAWQEYPLHVPLLIAILEPARNASGRLVAWLCATATTGLMLGMVKSGRTRALVCAATFLLWVAPEYRDQSRFIFANVPFALYVLLGFWALYGNASRRHWCIAGVALGTAAWTRTEGVLLACAIALPAVLIDGRRRAADIGRFLLLLTAFVLPWQAYMRWFSPSGPPAYTQFGDVLNHLIHGNVAIIEASAEVLTFAAANVLSPSGRWGLTWLVVFGSFVALGPWLWRYVGAGISAVAAYCLAVLGMYTLVPQDFMPLNWWLESGFNRVLLGVAPAALVWSATVLDLGQRRILAAWLRTQQRSAGVQTQPALGALAHRSLNH